MKYKMITLLLMVLLIASCGGKYEQKDGVWIWIQTNEGGQQFSPMDVDNSSFEILENKEYAKDKNSVFRKGSIINGADPITFTILTEDGYAKDKNHIYFEAIPLIHVDINSFETLQRPYSKDKNTVFCGNLPMKVDDVNSFKVTKSVDFVSYTSIKLFTERNPEYAWLDTLNVSSIIVGEQAEGESSNHKYKGFQLVD